MRLSRREQKRVIELWGWLTLHMARERDPNPIVGRTTKGDIIIYVRPSTERFPQPLKVIPKARWQALVEYLRERQRVDS